MLRPASNFVPWRAGLAAPVATARDYQVFLQVAGPWALLLVGITAGLAFAVQKAGPRPPAALVLGGVCLLLVLLALSVPTIAAAWFRWAVVRTRPAGRVALPGGAALDLLWRVWLVFIPLDLAIDWAGAQAAGAAAAIVVPLAWAAVIWALAYPALALPARAVGDRSFRLAQGRSLGGGHGLGFLLALAPYLIVGRGLHVLARSLGGGAVSPQQLVVMAVQLLLVFAAVASGAQYLSQAYLAARGAR